MWKKFMILLAILILLVILFHVISNQKNTEEAEFKILEINIGDQFTSLSYEHPMYLLNYVVKDVTGDNHHDMVMAIGEKDTVAENGPFQNIDIVVYDSVAKSFHKAGLKKVKGKFPKVVTANLDDSPNLEMILMVENEDMTKSLNIISMQGGEMKEIFKPRDNKGLIFTGYFMDGFKTYVSARKIKLERYLDLHDNKDNYISSGFYDADGRVLKENQMISTTGFTDIQIVPTNDRQGLKTTQRILGFDYLDILDEVEVLWKFENGTWQIKEASGKKLGNLLY